MGEFPGSVSRHHPRLGVLGLLALLLLTFTVTNRPAAAQSPAPQATPLPAVQSAVVNFAELAEKEKRLGVSAKPPARPLKRREEEDNDQEEPGADVKGEPSLFRPSFIPFAASPTPTTSFIGLDDIPMADSSYIIIPPDVSGAVGLTKILQGQNNNYRILNKSNGAVLSTVGTATFWSAIEPAAFLAQLTDPRTVYDPYNDRFIAVMQSVQANGDVLLGVSQTGDPSGAWNLYRFNGFTGSYLIDFPIVGFNKNWIAITINRYTSGGAFSLGICLAVNYPLARTGTGSATLFSQAAGTHFCTAPAVTYSATEDTLFLITHLSSGSATYQVDRITGTSAAPVYSNGGTSTRPGGGWTQPSGNQLPQSGPNAGTSACGATPCPMESQDSQVRSAPVYRNGLLYYTQTIGLPSGSLTHTAVQWTRITPSTTPAFSDGGRIEDPTATSTNGGKWYVYPHIAVNQNNDFMIGYTQCSSAQHPAAGYSVHLAGDAAGSMRDALIYHAGEDYYHKTFSTTTGRNRWGDFSSAQVDPSDDMTLWTVQQYGKTRVGTNDGNTGANSSRWSTWWTALAPPNVTLDAGPSVNEGNSGTTAFNFTARLSYAYGLPVTVNFQTSDGTATVANNDYQALSSSIIIPAGSLTGTITINVNGDTTCEPSETFNLTLTSANNHIPLGATVAVTGTILNDEVSTITASAGTGGTISPSGGVQIGCGTDQSFTISPDLCHVIADVLVDGVSQGAQTSYTFTNVTTNHTISASFSPKMTLSQTHTNVSCNGVSDGAIDLSVSGGVGGLSYAWSNGATTQDVSGLAAGPYSVTVTDANNCVSILNVSITQPPVLALSETHVNLASCGASNGSIDLTVAGGTPPYGYSWTNGATTEDLSGLAAGTYTCTVTDAHGCTALQPVTISAPGAPGLSETHVNVSCNGGSNGTVDLTVTGGAAPYSYAWSNGATSQDLSGLAAGTYNVTVTDASNCTALLGVTVTQPAVLALSETHANVCTGGSNGSVDLTVAGGTAPYGYAWSNGATTEDLSGLTAGNYNVTVTDAHGCTQGLGVTISVTQQSIVATAGPNGTITPPGNTLVPCGTDQTYTITPDPGYTINTLIVDSSPVTPAPSYTFTNVTAPHTIDASFAVVTAVVAAPTQLVLGAVVPNPTRGTMQVPFGLPAAASVHVSIVDLQGRELAVLISGEYPAGWHNAAWNGRTANGQAGAGLYFVRYRQGGHTLMQKFVLAR